MQLITSMTTVVTFVMVFIIQSTQNRESRAMQTKLDALLIANDHLDERRFLGLEQQPDAAIKDVQTEVHGIAPEEPSGGPEEGGRPEGARNPTVRTRT
jgi:low affinity Fe/Cu permease